MLRFLRTLCCGLTVLAAFSTSAADDVGVVDRLSGEVTVKSSAGNQFSGTPFMKVREGDLLVLKPGSVVQMVYFDARRRELWKGASSFTAGSAGGTAVTGQAISVSEVKGVRASKSLAYAGNVQRLGSLTLRSVAQGPDDATIAQAQADYLLWVAAAAPDDILPELSMLGLLRERQDPALIAPYLQALRRKQPGRSDINALIKQYQGSGAQH
jgi:hypothetical protein